MREALSRVADLVAAAATGDFRWFAQTIHTIVTRADASGEPNGA